MRGDCGSSVFGLATSFTVTGMEALAARAAAERSEDALGGGSGGACPSETRDVEDVFFFSVGAGCGSDDSDVDDTTF